MRRFTDLEIVFHYEGTGRGMERTLEANEDGTLTYDESPNYYAYRGEGQGREIVADGSKNAVPRLR